MKKSILVLARVLLNVLYSLFKLLPVKKKITYISRQSNEISVDFQLLKNEMEKQYPDYQNVMLTKMIGDSLFGKMEYCFHMLCQMYHVATSEMVILDTYCIVVSFLKQRENLVVIQMWHALGALKKFGYSILDKGEGSSRNLAEVMQMHRNYSYVFCSSDFCKPFFAEAFDVTLDKMVSMPLPRLDLVMDKEYVDNKKREILEVYPEIGNKAKKTIVYAPTFRKNEKQLKEAIEHFAEGLDYERYNLVVKLHPLSKTRIEHSSVIQDNKFSTVDVCQFADAIVLDYSAVVFELLMLQKPLYFYVFDYETYMEKRDFYIDYKKYVPGKIVNNSRELLSSIEENQAEQEKTAVFRELMIKPNANANYTEDMARFLGDLLEKA